MGCCAGTEKRAAELQQLRTDLDTTTDIIENILYIQNLSLDTNMELIRQRYADLSSSDEEREARNEGVMAFIEARHPGITEEAIHAFEQGNANPVE